jgi:hypothetical protein
MIAWTAVAIALSVFGVKAETSLGVRWSKSLQWLHSGRTFDDPDSLAEKSAPVDPIDHTASIRRMKLDATPRIVGGNPAAANPSYGFSAGSKLCGGTLIHPEYVRLSRFIVQV